MAEGVKEATEYPGFTQRGATIRQITSLLEQVPDGSTVFVFGGTNDAASTDGAELAGDTRMLLDLGDIKHLKLTLVGPPCVYTHYDEIVGQVDRTLQSISNSFGSGYVSTRSGPWCSRRLRARDGVHFPFSGYVLLWESVRRQADEQARNKVFGAIQPLEKMEKP